MNADSRSIPIPKGLLEQLASFRRALLARAAHGAVLQSVAVLLFAFLGVVLLDRFVETPVIVRWALLAMVVGVVVWVTARLLRLVRASRGPVQIAGLICKLEPVFGDHLQGALELSESESEQTRSTSLCVAALAQVADETNQRDLKSIIPELGRPWWYWLALACFVVWLCLALAVPGLVIQSGKRLLAPWVMTPRYTFVSLEAFDADVVVPRDETTDWSVAINESSRWKPATASLTLGPSTIVSETRRGNEYRFEIPKQIEMTEAKLSVGDARVDVHLIPKLRPTLSKVSAEVKLPGYLGGITESQELRQGALGIIAGSQVMICATASSEIGAVTVRKGSSEEGFDIDVSEREMRFHLPPNMTEAVIDWQDSSGLSASEPLRVATEVIEDRSPTLVVRSEAIPGKLLSSHQLAFDVAAEDDFGVRRVAVEWSCGESRGQRVLGGASQDTSLDKLPGSVKEIAEGRGDRRVLELASAFHPESLNITGGKVTLRFAVIDDMPGREPVYSSPITLDVLSPSDHAVWVSDEFEKWRQAAMDVRDRELNLYQRNRQLHQVAMERRDAAWVENAKRQARDEQLNGRLLESLTVEGEQLLRQAARNEQVSAEYVETLAKTIETLESLAGESMPGVAEGLAAAAEEAQRRAKAQEEEESKFAAMADQETSQGNAKRGGGQQDSEEKDEGLGDQGATKERIGLAGTTIVDTTKRQEKEGEKKTEVMVDVLDDQATLVAEFDAVAEELSELLGKMEGSTLVKRLKSVSRLQDKVAVTLGREISATFGETPKKGGATRGSTREAARDLSESAKQIRTVLDDLDALCERRDIEHFKVVLQEMKSFAVLDEIQSLSRAVSMRPGLAISESEYWADNLDRWADDLVDPRGGESKAGLKTTKSLPPELILEVLRVLEAEVGLRDRTRVAEQSRETASRDQYMSQAIRLSEDQDLLRDRVDVIVQRLESEAEGVMHYASEIEVLAAASSAMVDASKTLVQPETGPAAIAAETEAIELLLRSKKVSPDSGGGGGSSAGGGSGGTTEVAAARLLGRGLNELATLRESETELGVGRNRDQIPVQWREGLDAYFQGMEARRQGNDQQGNSEQGVKQ